MRITCTTTPEGNVYFFFGNDRNVYDDLKPLVSFLLASDVDILVGNADGEPRRLLRVGPIGGDDEAELLRLAERHIDTRCPTVPA